MRRFSTLILLGALLVPGARVLADEGATPEAKLVLSEAEARAGFILNFARFVEWPANSFPVHLTDPIRIAVTDECPITDELRRLSLNFRVQGHPVEVVVLSDAASALSCQMVYLDHLNENEFRGDLAAWKGQSLLVVGDVPETARWGAGLAFKPEKNRLQFIVNRRAAREGGLTFSAQLLKLASQILD